MPPTASLWAKTKSSWRRSFTAGRKMRSSWFPMACSKISAKALASAGTTLTEVDADCSRSTASKFPELADQIDRMQQRELPDGWDKDLPTFPADAKGMATRESSGKVLNVVAQNVPWLIGGSADLATSNKTTLKFDGAGDFQAGSYGGRNLHFGVREHAMGSASEWHGALEGAALRWNVLQFQRLHAAHDPSGRNHGNPGHLRLHARFDRLGRRRADAPAGGAAGRRCARFRA